MKRLFLLISLLGFSARVFAQVSNEHLEYRDSPDTSKVGQLYLNIQNLNFLRNYEYFNRIQDGYTLFGTQLEPQVVYYPHAQLSLSAGVHLRKDFGGKGIYKTIPMFSIKYEKGSTRLINGVLEGSVNHRLIEPLYDLERRITEPVEYGTQFIMDKKMFFLDVFINWEKMIYKPSAEQEQIYGGVSADIGLIRGKRVDLSLPLQLTAFHRGGQIDTDPTPLQTIVNTAAGFKLKLALDGFIESVETNNYFALYKDFSFTKAQAFENGNGLYLNAGLTSKYGYLGGTFWRGDSFTALQGMPVFQSVSQHINHPGLTMRKRELLILSYSYQKKLLPNLYMDFRLEPLIDLSLDPADRKLEFANTTFLVYRQEFRLKK